jgi:hypothetical protein
MAVPMTISATITAAMTHPVADELLAAEGSERVAAIPRWSVAKQRPVVGAVIPNRVATSCVLANCARCCTPRSQCQSAIAVVRLRFGHITEIEGGASELVSCHRRSIGPGASDDEFVDADVADGEAQHIGQNRRGEGDCRGCFGVLVDPSLDELDARRRTGSAEVNGAGMVLDSRALRGDGPSGVDANRTGGCRTCQRAGEPTRTPASTRPGMEAHHAGGRSLSPQFHCFMHQVDGIKLA